MAETCTPIALDEFILCHFVDMNVLSEMLMTEVKMMCGLERPASYVDVSVLSVMWMRKVEMMCGFERLSEMLMTEVEMMCGFERPVRDVDDKSGNDAGILTSSQTCG